MVTVVFVILVFNVYQAVRLSRADIVSSPKDIVKCGVNAMIVIPDIIRHKGNLH